MCGRAIATGEITWSAIQNAMGGLWSEYEATFGNVKINFTRVFTGNASNLESREYGRDLVRAVEAIGMVGAVLKIGHKGLKSFTDVNLVDVGKAFKQLRDKRFNVTEVVAPENYWQYSPIVRGQKVDEFLGNNLGKTFMTVDKLINRELFSTKSLDPRLPSYKDTPKKVYDTIKKDLDELDNFTSHAQRVTLYNGTSVDRVVGVSDYDKKIFELALPDVELSSEQLQYLTQAIEYSKTLNKNVSIDFVIKIVKV